MTREWITARAPKRPIRGRGSTRVGNRRSIADARIGSQVSGAVETESQSPGCETVVTDAQHRQLLWLMAEFFRTVGCTDLRARLPGFTPPQVLSGTLEDHRPDLICRQTNQARTALILEVVPPHELESPLQEHRWTLLSSAAKLYGAELHFAVPRWSQLGAPDQLLRRRLQRMEIVTQRVWTP